MTIFLRLSKLLIDSFFTILDALVLGAILTYAAAFFLLMSFCAPYWIESYPESFSSFKNMGLWEYCFKDFDYPYYQFPKQFNGCHNIFSFVSGSRVAMSAMDKL